MLLNRTSTLAVISAFLSPVADILAPKTDEPETALSEFSSDSKRAASALLPKAAIDPSVLTLADTFPLVSAVTVEVS